MKYIFFSAILFTSCVVYKAPDLSKFKEPTVLCHCKSDSLTTIQIQKVFPDSCKHYYTMVTLLGCPPGIKCNTATCLSCGKTFPSY